MEPFVMLHVNRTLIEAVLCIYVSLCIDGGKIRWLYRICA
jgi:hypothetical protein